MNFLLVICIPLHQYHESKQVHNTEVTRYLMAFLLLFKRLKQRLKVGKLAIHGLQLIRARKLTRPNLTKSLR